MTTATTVTTGTPGAAGETTGHSQRLRGKIALVLPELLAVGRALMDHPRIAELYPEYLFTLHCMTRASVPLMEAALGQARALADRDPVAAALVPYLVKHIPEERHAHWLLQDLEVLGFARDEVVQRPPSPTVAALVGSQYYWIFHYHPVALLGYMEIAEGYPPTAQQVETLIARTGYPANAFRSLSRHARLDLHHRDDLHEVLDSLPLTPQHSAIIGMSALQSVHLASLAIGEISAG